MGGRSVEGRQQAATEVKRQQAAAVQGGGAPLGWWGEPGSLGDRCGGWKKACWRGVGTADFLHDDAYFWLIPAFGGSCFGFAGGV